MKRRFTLALTALTLLVFLTPQVKLIAENQQIINIIGADDFSPALQERGGEMVRATKTEGFETKSASTTYNSTVNITTEESDCSIAWTIYYGCVSTNNKISDTKSAQMRWYSSATSNLPYIKSNTPIDNLTKVAFKAKVGNKDNVKMDVWYSNDGSTWSSIATAVTFSNTNANDFDYDIPSGGKYIKIGVSSESTAPTSGNYTFFVDDVVFTYTSSSSVNDPTFDPAGGNYTSAQNVEINCATDGATIYYTTDGSVPTNASTTYTNPINVDATTTIKAIAYKGEDYSGVVQATYNILTPLTTMDAIFAKATEVGSTATLVAVTFDDWVVSGVYEANAYVTDGTKGFNIYKSGHGFTVGDVLSGTAFCNLKLNTGYARFTDLTKTTDGLTVTSGGTVSAQTAIGIADLTGVNTGALLSYENLTCTKTTTVTLTDASSNSIQAYTTLFNDALNSFNNGLIYNVTGVYTQYNSTKEILPRSAADIEELAITSISASNVNLAYSATSGEIPYTVNYSHVGGVLTAAKDASEWISNVTVDGANNKVTFDVTQNMTNAERSGVITLTYTYAAKETVTKQVTVTQGVRDYATLPVIFDGGKNDFLPGFSQTGLGSDYDYSPKLKFDHTNDYLILKINETATQLHFDIKGNSFSEGTFKVQWSADGSSYTDLATYTELNGTVTKSYDLNSTARYIKWIYTTKENGNVALGHIRVSANSHDIFLNNILNNLTISAGNTYTVYSPAVLTLTGTTTNAAADLVIKDGAQLIHAADVNATMEKNITGYAKGGSGWYTIASPVDGFAVSTLTDDTYDLYSYDEANHLWYNQEAHTGDFTTLSRGTGYLYANSSAKTVSFAGSMKATNAEVTVPLSWASDVDALKGFNLVGNPFTRNLTSGEVTLNGSALTTYYVIENGSEWVTRNLTSNPIKPGQGFLVQATDASQNLVFNPSAKGETATKPAFICIEAGNEGFMDCAYVQIGQGNTLRKMTMNENVPHVYVMNNGKDYAAATIENATGEIPVGFNAAYDGIYTINVNSKGLEADYLHLIDKVTGADIDLLTTPSYSFEANTGNNANRFRLVFAANDVDEYSENTSFAYFNGSEWVVENDGQATLQVIDVMGRMLRNEVISGNATTRTDNLSAGVYVMRLVNGEKVKTQKIVVEQ